MSDVPPSTPAPEDPPSGGPTPPPPSGPAQPDPAAPPPAGWTPPAPGTPPPPGGWGPAPGSAAAPGWGHPPQQIVVKQGPGCMKIGLIVAGVLLIFGILGIGCVALLGNEVAKEIDKSMGTADAADYELSEVSCSEDEIIGPKASGSITNTSDKAQGFHLTIRWETTDGVLVAENPVFTDTIKVGQSQLWSTSSFEDVPEGSEVTCEVSKVEYSIFDDEE